MSTVTMFAPSTTQPIYTIRSLNHNGSFSDLGRWYGYQSWHTAKGVQKLLQRQIPDGHFYLLNIKGT